MNDTTKRFARVSQAEPWRNVVTHYKRPLASRVWDVLFASVLAAAAGVALFYGLS
jgi:hypothetical protein